MEGIELIKKRMGAKPVINGLPILYQTFLDTYSTGKGAFNIKFFKLNDDLIQLTSVTYFGVDNYENSISHFISSKELEVEFKNYNERVDTFHREGFIRIGLFDMNDTILLGIAEDNKDTIWRLNGDRGDDRPYMEKIENSIFDFVNSFRQVVIKMNLLVRRVDEGRLFKNWGEDFWRVRENKQDV